MKKVKNYVPFDGSCPFLTCLETGPHVHPVCPECGAVRYGNIFCGECRKQAGIWTNALREEGVEV